MASYGTFDAGCYRHGLDNHVSGKEYRKNVFFQVVDSMPGWRRFVLKMLLGFVTTLVFMNNLTMRTLCPLYCMYEKYSRLTTEILYLILQPSSNFI
jgi:hypothetical protein